MYHMFISGLEQKCPVCLLEYETDEQVKQMPCKHVFHPDCLLVWLNKVQFTDNMYTSHLILSAWPCIVAH